MNTENSKKSISYVIRALLDAECCRHLRISGDASLHALAVAICGAFDCPSDCCYVFFMDNVWWSAQENYFSPLTGMDPYADSVRLSAFGLKAGQPFKLILEYAENLRVQCEVLQVLEEETKEPEIVLREGESPELSADDGDEDEYDQAEILSFRQAQPSDSVPEPGPFLVPEIPDALFEAAFQFRSDRLWADVSGTEMFAVQLSDGEIGYCSAVSYDSEEFIRFMLFIGDTGLWAIQQILEDEKEPFAVQIAQNCLHLNFCSGREMPEEQIPAVKAYAKAHGISLRGKSRYPVVTKYQSYLVPSMLRDSADDRCLTEALRAAHAVWEKLQTVSKASLGFDQTDAEIPLLIPEADGYRWSKVSREKKVSFPYVRPLIPEETAAALRALPQKGVLEGAVMIMNETALIPPSMIVYKPLLFAVGNTEKQTMRLKIVGYYPEIAAQLLAEFAARLLASGECPAEIHTVGERSAAFFSNLCAQCGIRLTVADSLPKLDDMVGAFTDQETRMIRSHEANILRMLNTVSDMSDEQIRMLPEEIQNFLRMMLGGNDLPEDLQKRLEKLL